MDTTPSHETLIFNCYVEYYVFIIFFLSMFWYLFLPFALVGIGLTQRTQSPFLRIGSRVMD
jgi:hypothetical protein